MGIGIVCPASDIMTVLNQPEVVRNREEEIKAREAAEKAKSTPDSLGP